MNRYQSVVIVGAGRSGTNMLRDSLVSLSGYGTWPCDEINYIWRHGNRGYPSEEIPPELALPIAQPYINRAFDKMALATQCEYLVEKTCANTLRIPFVDSIVPGAKYVNIIRDGRDVVASAMKRWEASLDLRYIARKARYVPVTDLPYYSLRYASHRLKKLLAKERVLPVWGPVYNGMREDAQLLSLPEVCAKQWVRCVEKSQRALDRLPADRVMSLRYEDFVESPAAALENVTVFLGDTRDHGSSIEQVVKGIVRDSVGGGIDVLHRNSSVMNILSPMLDSLKRG